MIILRKANAEDIAEIYAMIVELAEYEQAANEVSIDMETLLKEGFGPNPLFETIVAENENEIIGMAFYYISYSTWKGKCIYLEDIIVKLNYRNQGIGKILFEQMIKQAKELGAKRLSWQVLNWNEPAIQFYKKFDATISSEWLNGRLTEKQIQEYQFSN